MLLEILDMSGEDSRNTLAGFDCALQQKSGTGRFGAIHPGIFWRGGCAVMGDKAHPKAEWLTLAKADLLAQLFGDDVGRIANHAADERTCDHGPYSEVGRNRRDQRRWKYKSVIQLLCRATNSTTQR